MCLYKDASSMEFKYLLDVKGEEEIEKRKDFLKNFDAKQLFN